MVQAQAELTQCYSSGWKVKKGSQSVKSFKCLMATYHITLTSGWLDFTLCIQMSGIIQTQPQQFNQSTTFIENPACAGQISRAWRTVSPHAGAIYKILLISPPGSTLSPFQTTRILKHHFQDLSWLAQNTCLASGFHWTLVTASGYNWTVYRNPIYELIKLLSSLSVSKPFLS